MAKTIIIQNPLGNQDVYTEGSGGVYKIYMKYSGWDILNVKIEFTDGKVRNYYSCKALIGDNILPPVPAPNPLQNVLYKFISSSDILANVDIPLLPAPSSGFAYILNFFAMILDVGSIAYYNNNTGIFKLKANNTLAAVSAFSPANFRATSYQAFIAYIKTTPTYFPVTLPVTSPVIINNTIVNTLGDGVIHLYLGYNEVVYP